MKRTQATGVVRPDQRCNYEDNDLICIMAGISSEACADLQIGSCYLMLLTYGQTSWGRGKQHVAQPGEEKEEWQENERAGAGQRLGCSLRRRGKRGGAR